MVMWAYALAFFLAFGAFVEDFSDLFNSFYSLFRCAQTTV